MEAIICYLRCGSNFIIFAANGLLITRRNVQENMMDVSTISNKRCGNEACSTRHAIRRNSAAVPTDGAAGELIASTIKK
jgi:hypothetical protein